MIVECPGCKLRYDVSGRPAHTQARCRCGTVFELPPPPASADYLQCPQCAAAVEPGTGACGYCQAALMVKACPRCFGRMFHGAAHCRHCGAAVEVAASVDVEGDATPRGCPRCPDAQVLEGRLVGDYLIDECNACHGIFVDVATFERIVVERRKASPAEAMGFARPDNKPADTSRPGAMYIKCPDCAQLMNRHNFGRSSGVIVDACRAHGTWFDVDELPRIIGFVQDGGMEKAARRDIERQKEAARVRMVPAVAPRMEATGRSFTGGHLGGSHDILGSIVVGIGGLLVDMLLD